MILQRHMKALNQEYRERRATVAKRVLIGGWNRTRQRGCDRRVRSEQRRRVVKLHRNFQLKSENDGDEVNDLNVNFAKRRAKTQSKSQTVKS